MAQRGQLICEQLKACGVEYVAWLPDSETRFLHVALQADPAFRMIPVCSDSFSTAPEANFFEFGGLGRGRGF